MRISIASRLLMTGSVISVAIASLGPSAALARRSDSTKGGKKPIGEVQSFDGSTLVVVTKDGSSWTGEVASDVQVKVEHRGKHSPRSGRGNPTRGSVADITPGAKVLRLKVDDVAVEKIRLRAATDSVVEEPPAPEDDAEGDVSEEDAQTPGEGSFDESGDQE